MSKFYNLFLITLLSILFVGCASNVDNVNYNEPKKIVMLGNLKVDHVKDVREDSKYVNSYTYKTTIDVKTDNKCKTIKYDIFTLSDGFFNSNSRISLQGYYKNRCKFEDVGGVSFATCRAYTKHYKHVNRKRHGKMRRVRVHYYTPYYEYFAINSNESNAYTTKKAIASLGKSKSCYNYLKKAQDKIEEIE